MEGLIALVLFGVLMTAVAFSLNPILLGWSSHQDRMELQRQTQHGMERILRDLRLAQALQEEEDSDAIRYTLRSGGADPSYILYFYNEADAWPPDFSQATYQLRKASLTGGIGGTFAYGDGQLLLRDVKPPPASDLSADGLMATMDLALIRADETFRLLERVKRRN